jgi:hypothetical protein
MVRLRRHMAGEFVEVIQHQIGQSPSIHDPKLAGNHFLPSQELIQLIQPFVAAQ